MVDRIISAAIDSRLKGLDLRSRNLDSLEILKSLRSCENAVEIIFANTNAISSIPTWFSAILWTEIYLGSNKITRFQGEFSNLVVLVLDDNLLSGKLGLSRIIFSTVY